MHLPSPKKKRTPIPRRRSRIWIKVAGASVHWKSWPQTKRIHPVSFLSHKFSLLLSVCLSRINKYNLHKLLHPLKLQLQRNRRNWPLTDRCGVTSLLRQLPKLPKVPEERFQYISQRLGFSFSFMHDMNRMMDVAVLPNFIPLFYEGKKWKGTAPDRKRKRPVACLLGSGGGAHLLLLACLEYY